MSVSKQRRMVIGAWLWVASLQYYLVQVVVAAAYGPNPGYSWAHNTISDLANTACGPYGKTLVCSPQHVLMNVSFRVLGITMLCGAFLLARQLKGGRILAFGFGCMMLAGIGTIIVGLFPENTVSGAHILGAALSFVFGNIGMILIGSRLKTIPRGLRLYTIASGAIGLMALVLYTQHAYLGLGNGGMERVIAYPQSIWMIVFGTYLLLAKSSPAK